jgi:large subunit ribosomal protein L7/L12
MLSRLISPITTRSLARLSFFRLSSFDVAAKLKDSSDGKAASSESAKKRKPSDRVIRLTDEILNLSLVEAADLCDLCNERLGGTKAPAGFFPMMAPAGYGAMPAALAAAGPAVATPPAAAAAPAPAGGAASQAAAAAPAAKSTVTIKLVSFDAGKKVQTVKEVRAMTALGLKEAKEAVEAAPKVLKKGVPIEEANMWKKKLEEECGAVVELE